MMMRIVIRSQLGQFELEVDELVAEVLLLVDRARRLLSQLREVGLAAQPKPIAALLSLYQLLTDGVRLRVGLVPAIAAVPSGEHLQPAVHLDLGRVVVRFGVEQIVVWSWVMPLLKTRVHSCSVRRPCRFVVPPADPEALASSQNGCGVGPLQLVLIHLVEGTVFADLVLPVDEDLGNARPLAEAQRSRPDCQGRRVIQLLAVLVADFGFGEAGALGEAEVGGGVSERRGRLVPVRSFLGHGNVGVVERPLLAGRGGPHERVLVENERA